MTLLPGGSCAVFYCLFLILFLESRFYSRALSKSQLELEGPGKISQHTIFQLFDLNHKGRNYIL